MKMKQPGLKKTASTTWWHRRLWALVVAGSIAAAGLLLIAYISLSGSEARLPADYEFFPGSDLGVDLGIEQWGMELSVSVYDVAHKSQANGSLISWSSGQLPFSWQAVRVVGAACNGHVFLQHARYGSPLVGELLFDGSPQSAIIALKPEDHGHFYCLQIEADDRYLYVRSAQPIYVRPPRTAPLWQLADALFLELDASYSLRPTQVRVRSITVSDEVFRQYQRDEAFGLEFNSCHRQLFEDFGSAVRESYSLPDILRYRPIVDIQLQPEDVGSKICTEISVPATGESRLTSYRLSHRIAGLGETYLPPTAIEGRLPEEFGLREALEIFSSQLTEEGRSILSTVSITSEEIRTGGWLTTGYTQKKGLFGFLESTDITLNDKLFPDHYGRLSEGEKLSTIKTAVNAVAHELMHVIDVEEDFKEASSNCQREVVGGIANRLWAPGTVRRLSAEWQDFFDQLRRDPDTADWDSLSLSSRKDIETYWNFWETYDDCLAADARHGQLYAALKTQALNFHSNLYQTDFTLSDLFRSFDIEHRWNKRLGTPDWYREVYAEAVLSSLRLPTVLEDYYGRFFVDRAEFADIMYEDDTLWEW